MLEEHTHRELVITDPNNPLSRAIYENPLISLGISAVLVVAASITGRTATRLYFEPTNQMLAKYIAMKFGAAIGFITGFFVGNDALPIGQRISQADDNPVKQDIGDDRWGQVYPYSSPVFFGIFYSILGEISASADLLPVLTYFVHGADVVTELAGAELGPLEAIYP